jgi:cytoskeletal protein RodZ
MDRLGERLRLARESQGISLSQAAAETRILQRYLVALEDSDYLNLPGDVYTRGFIRNYAGFLGLPPEELIELYRAERGRTDPIQIIPATSAPRIRLLFAPSVVGVFFVVLTMVGLSYLVLTTTSRIGENVAISQAPTVAPTNAPEPSPLPTPRPSATAAAIAAAPTQAIAGAALPTALPTATPEPEAPIVVEVRVDPGDHRGSWLDIQTDGESVYRQVLGPGLSLRYTAQRDLSIRAGNASVVTVVINGQEQRLGTTPGEVVTFNWPP